MTNNDNFNGNDYNSNDGYNHNPYNAQPIRNNDNFDYNDHTNFDHGNQNYNNYSQNNGYPTTYQPDNMYYAPQGQNYAPQHNGYTNEDSNYVKKWFATAGIAALLGGLIGGGATYGLEHGKIGTTNVTQQHLTQNVKGGVNWNETAKTASASVVTIKVADSTGSGDSGSGVVYDNDGDIITNNHVIEAAKNGGQIQVTVGNKAYTAKIVGSDTTADIAVIKLLSKPDIPFSPIKFADSSAVKTGDNVMAVGSPLGLSDTATTGIVSALQRPVLTQESNSNDYVVTNAIQTSAPINPGNSGGALVNINGELIGINSSIASLSNSSSESSGQSGSIGIGFAIPSNQVKNIVEQILKNGTSKHAYLGMTPSDSMISDSRNSGTLGVKINKISSGGAAEKAGLKTGDIITKIDDHTIVDSEALIATIREHNPGDKVKVTYTNSYGKSGTKDVTLGEQPQSN